MFWQILSILLAAALLVLHLRWRQNCLRIQAQGSAALDRLREQQRQQAAQIQTRQETLFNSMVEGLLLLDPQGRIQLANRAFGELFEVATDVRGMTVLEVLRQHELTGLLARVEAERQVLGYQLKLGGFADRSVEINAAGILGQDGEGQGTVLVFHDLTRLKLLERTREEFVANVSHELRTPLSLIKGYVETLIDGARDNPEVCLRFLQTIHRNAERLHFLIEDLLIISELESGRVTLNVEELPLVPLVDRVLEDFKNQARSKNVTLTNAVAQGVVRADANRLHQVLGNLVGNAIKYGRNDGHVTLSAAPAALGLIEVCVQDDGPGIAPESLERVFERFYRVDKARSREQGGTGLGLSIVKHIVQNHGGRVWAKSEPGKGSSFFFTLPGAD